MYAVPGSAVLVDEIGIVWCGARVLFTAVVVYAAVARWSGKLIAVITTDIDIFILIFWY